MEEEEKNKERMNYDTLMKEYFNDNYNGLLKLLGYSGKFTAEQQNIEVLKEGLYKLDNLLKVTGTKAPFLLHTEYQTVAQSKPPVNVRLLVYKSLILDMLYRKDEPIVAILQVVLYAKIPKTRKKAVSKPQYVDEYTTHGYNELSLSDTPFSKFYSIFGESKAIIFGVLCQMENYEIEGNIKKLENSLLKQFGSAERKSELGSLLVQLKDISVDCRKEVKIKVQQLCNRMSEYISTTELAAMQKGEQNAKREIAREMQKEGDSIEKIARVLKLSLPEVKALLS